MRRIVASDGNSAACRSGMRWSNRQILVLHTDQAINKPSELTNCAAKGRLREEKVKPHIEDLKDSREFVECKQREETLEGRQGV